MRILTLIISIYMVAAQAANCTEEQNEQRIITSIGLPSDGTVTPSDFIATVKRHKCTVEQIGLTYFSTTTSSFPARDILDLVDILKESPRLRVVDLWETGLDEANLLLLFAGLKGHQSLEVIRMCYRNKPISESVTDNLIELIKTCPNLCGVLTRGRKTATSSENHWRLYAAACESRNGHVMPFNWGFKESMVPKEWLDRSTACGGRYDHPHGWSGCLKDDLLVFAKKTDPEEYSAYQPVEGKDYFRRPLSGKITQEVFGKNAVFDIQEAYFVMHEYGGPYQSKNMQDIKRYVAQRRFEKTYDQVTEGFKSGLSTPELWQTESVRDTI